MIFRVSVSRKALDNLSEAPIEEILKKFKDSGAMDKVDFFQRKRTINFDSDQSDVACGVEENVRGGAEVHEEDC